MNADDIIAALDFPDSARINRRIPKKLLVENGANTAADKRRINEGIEEIHWIAALKPANIGVPEYSDETREYLEIEIVSTTLHAGAHSDRISELIHRAIPYPVFLIIVQDCTLAISFAHKRRSQNKAGATIIADSPVTAGIKTEQNDQIINAFLSSLPLGNQPRINLFALYQRWMDTIFSLLAAEITGVFSLPKSPEHAAERQTALAEYARLEAQISGIQAAAAREKQLARKVELNLKLKDVQAQYFAARAKL